MRVVFMGSPAAVLAPLKKLQELHQQHRIQLVAVVSQPPRPVGRRSELIDPPVAAYGKAGGELVLQPEKASHPDFLKQFADLKPDVVITAAYGQILSDAFLAIPRRATINIHPSLLPQYRGATPVPQALLDGLQETAVSILFTVKKLDAGALILQRRVPIEPQETADLLTDRLFHIGAEMLAEALACLQDPSFKGTPQTEDQVSFCRKIQKEDGLVDWLLPATEILDRFRAYYPWPGSFAFLHDKRVVFETMALAPLQVGGGLKPGEFRYAKKEVSIIVGTASGLLMIARLKPAGSKSLDAAAFWNGLKLKDVGTFHVDA